MGPKGPQGAPWGPMGPPWGPHGGAHGAWAEQGQVNGANLSPAVLCRLQRASLQFNKYKLHWRCSPTAQRRGRICRPPTGGLQGPGGPWGPHGGPMGPLGAPWAPWGPNLAKSAPAGGFHFQKNHKKNWIWAFFGSKMVKKKVEIEGANLMISTGFGPN